MSSNLIRFDLEFSSLEIDGVPLGHAGNTKHGIEEILAERWRYHSVRKI